MFISKLKRDVLGTGYLAERRVFLKLLNMDKGNLAPNVYRDKLRTGTLIIPDIERVP